jgi:hypothetical protein
MYFPRRPTASRRSPRSFSINETPGGATAILAMLTSTLSIVLPTTAFARPRAIVSTSGSSGTVDENRGSGSIRCS